MLLDALANPPFKKQERGEKNGNEEVEEDEEEGNEEEEIVLIFKAARVGSPAIGRNRIS